MPVDRPKQHFARRLIKTSARPEPVTVAVLCRLALRRPKLLSQLLKIQDLDDAYLRYLARRSVFPSVFLDFPDLLLQKPELAALAAEVAQPLDREALQFAATLSQELSTTHTKALESDAELKSGLANVRDPHARMAVILSDAINDADDVHDSVQLKDYLTGLTANEKIKAALNGGKDVRRVLLKDRNKTVAIAVLKNPRITDSELLEVARNNTADAELIRLIADNRDWLKNYALTQALAVNPKTPLVKALKFLPSLSVRDLKQIGRSKDVLQPISHHARMIVLRRTS